MFRTWWLLLTIGFVGCAGFDDEYVNDGYGYGMGGSSCGCGAAPRPGLVATSPAATPIVPVNYGPQTREPELLR
jgi:hypothetical protein